MRTLPLLAGCGLAVAGILLACARLRWRASTRGLRNPARRGQPQGLWPSAARQQMRRCRSRSGATCGAPCPATGGPLRPCASARKGNSISRNPASAGFPSPPPQLVVLRRPGFDWDARIRLAPGLSVWVRDGYYGGEGLGEARLLALWPLATLHGGDRVAAGQLMRFLAEAPWYPVVLLPGYGVRWISCRRAPCGGRAGRRRPGGFAPVHLRRRRLRARRAGPRASAHDRNRHGRHALAGPLLALRGTEAASGFLSKARSSWILPDGPHPYWRGRHRQHRLSRQLPDAGLRLSRMMPGRSASEADALSPGRDGRRAERAPERSALPASLLRSSPGRRRPQCGCRRPR